MASYPAAAAALNTLLWPMAVVLLAATPIIAIALCIVLRARPDASLGDAAQALATVIRAMVRPTDRSSGQS